MESGNGDMQSNFQPEEDLEPMEAMILRSMNEGVITLECNGIISHANPSAERILGYEQAELKGKQFTEAFDDTSDNEHFRKIVHDLIERGIHTARTETNFKRKNGQIVDLSVATSYMDVDVCEPGMENVVVVFRDITAFRAMERARRRAVDHLSHELKTPLSIIGASLDKIARSDVSNDAREKTVNRIRRNLQRLMDIQEIVEQIITPREYWPTALVVNQEIERILQQIRKDSSHRKVNILNKLEHIETQSIDPEILAMILQTLVKNAVEATPDEGEVIVELHRLPSGIELQVKDNGVGIPIEDLEFVFDGFHHTQATEEYSTKNPFDFNAGGKGLELLRLKVLSEQGYFNISFESSRCIYIPTSWDHCPGRISTCDHIEISQGCIESGSTTFFVLFPHKNNNKTSN